MVIASGTGVQMRRTSSTPLLFLDFDGVLNSDAYFGRNPDVRGNDVIDRRLVQRLNGFLDTSGCNVIISSTWRCNRTMSELRGILSERGLRPALVARIIDKTYDLSTANRGKEISRFLNGKARGGTPFVIFDDDWDMEPVETHLVQTDPAVGLSRKDITRAHKILKMR